MQESEAVKKWCPMVRRSSVVGSYNVPYKDANCIASECMMWRWHENLLQCFKCKAIYSKDTSCPVCKTQLDPYYSGYCGLAGKPEKLV